MLAYGAASPLSAYFTNHAKRPWVPAIVAALSLGINVALSFVLIPRVGVIGGAVATTVSYVISVIVMMTIFARHARISAAVLVKPDLRDMGRSALALCPILRRQRT